VATWLVEIYLAKINQYHEMGSSVAYTSTLHDSTNKKDQSAVDYYRQKEHQAKHELKQLLETYQDYLHKDTVYKLVASHGHNAELIYYATLIGDDEKVMSHYITERNWIKALEILAKQVKKKERIRENKPLTPYSLHRPIWICFTLTRLS
jgi:hypothetical protein